jgi:DNA helicase II / ATP-dependent DNA helicase PcrA
MFWLAQQASARDNIYLRFLFVHPEFSLGKNGKHAFSPAPDQRRAIEHLEGPMLVVAGAGTGKTTVLARRIAHLINSHVAKPEEILAVTYTRNGAAELVTRAAEVLYPDLEPQRAAAKLLSSGLQADTFHACCFSLLRAAGIKFALLEDKDLFVLLRRRMKDLQLERFTKAADPGKFLWDLLEFFRRCHDELRTPDDFDSYLAEVESDRFPLPRVAKSKDGESMPREEVLVRCRELARVFRYIENLLQQEGLGTFGHIITRTVELLSRDKAALQSAQKRARFILIDEFQDSNVAQIQLAKLLGGEAANVFAVGDPDQAIYRFRGATSGAFDQFLKTFGKQRVARVTMSGNRRSTPPILNCAYQVIRCNPEVGSRELEDGGWQRQPLACTRLAQEKALAKARAVQAIVHHKNEEPEFIADTIEATRRRRPSMKYRDFAVLYRNHHHRKEVVDELQRRNIPVQVKGADLFDAPQVRDAIAVLCILDGADPIALFRVAALARFSVDAERFRAELALAGRDAVLESVLEKVPGGLEVMETVRQARRQLVDAHGMMPAAIRVMRTCFQLGDSFPLQRLQEFAANWSSKPKPLISDGTLREFLEYISYFREVGGTLSENAGDDDLVAALAAYDVSAAAPRDAVQLMTVHAAKGLEFSCVFVVRVSSGSLPNYYKETLVEFPQDFRSKDTAAEEDSKALHEQEERRLFYVAITRAMNELYLCGPFGSGKKDLRPAGYMRELLDKQTTVLRDSIECRHLPQRTLIDSIYAAAAPLPRVSEWVQLRARDDARLVELSASAIDQYERCPLAYKLMRDWQIPEQPAARMQFGAAMHSAVKAYFDGVRAGRPPDEETVIACFLDEFSKAKVEEEIQRELYEKDGRQQLTCFLRSELAKPNGEILQTERSVRFLVGGTTVRARIDRLDRIEDGSAVIADYKTGKPKTQEDADDSLQLSIYALAARHLGFPSAALVFVNLENCAAVKTSRSPAELLKTQEKVSTVARRIADGEFDPKPGLACSNCSYRSICPAHEIDAPCRQGLSQRSAAN